MAEFTPRQKELCRWGIAAATGIITTGVVPMILVEVAGSLINQSGVLLAQSEILAVPGAGTIDLLQATHLSTEAVRLMTQSARLMRASLILHRPEVMATSLAVGRLIGGTV